MPQGDAAVLEALGGILTAELTAINQYFVHAKMCANWGLGRLAERKRAESIGEMKDADRIIDRILYLGGTPNLQRLNPVCVGEDAVEQHRLDLQMELESVQRYNAAIAVAREKGDNGTRELLEEQLRGEEETIEWLEAQLYLVEKLGAEAYLAEQLG